MNLEAKYLIIGHLSEIYDRLLPQLKQTNVVNDKYNDVLLKKIYLNLQYAYDNTGYLSERWYNSIVLSIEKCIEVVNESKNKLNKAILKKLITVLDTELPKIFSVVFNCPPNICEICSDSSESS